MSLLPLEIQKKLKDTQQTIGIDLRIKQIDSIVESAKILHPQCFISDTESAIIADEARYSASMAKFGR